MQAQILTSKFGGELISFKLNGEEKIHQGKDCIDENGKIYWKRHSPILFPVVGKLKKNQTIIGGRTYEMPQHGFARDLEFEPLTKLDNFHSYMLKSNKYTLSRYPYDFELYTTYRIDENKLTTIYKVINTGITNMPFGIGGHPAFKIDIEQLKKGNYYLEFEEKEEKLQQRFIECLNSFNINAISECIKYLDELPFEVIDYVLSKTSGIKCPNWNYANTILQDYVRRKIDSVEKIQAEESGFKNQKQDTSKVVDF